MAKKKQSEKAVRLSWLQRNLKLAKFHADKLIWNEPNPVNKGIYGRVIADLNSAILRLEHLEKNDE
jgi:hypothetical protein